MEDPEELEKIELEEFSAELAGASNQLFNLSDYIEKEFAKWIEENSKGILLITEHRIFFDFETDYTKIEDSEEIALEKFAQGFTYYFNELIRQWVENNWPDRYKRIEQYLDFSLDDTIDYLHNCLREKYGMNFIEEYIGTCIAYEAIR